MWLLLIVILAQNPTGPSKSLLNTFTTYEDCVSERDRIGTAMKEAYPNDTDFTLVCEYRPSAHPTDS